MPVTERGQELRHRRSPLGLRKNSPGVSALGPVYLMLPAGVRLPLPHLPDPPGYPVDISLACLEIYREVSYHKALKADNGRLWFEGQNFDKWC